MVVKSGVAASILGVLALVAMTGERPVIVDADERYLSATGTRLLTGIGAQQLPEWFDLPDRSTLPVGLVSDDGSAGRLRFRTLQTMSAAERHFSTRLAAQGFQLAVVHPPVIDDRGRVLITGFHRATGNSLELMIRDGETARFIELSFRQSGLAGAKVAGAQ
jgi:hypothetical protein